MNDAIAIDFGTMRTKLSYIDPQRNTAELMRLGQDERPFVPSVFFLGEDGRRLFGDDATEYLDSDPLAFLPRPLKRELREQWVRAGNRVKATPTELLSLLFAGLRNRTKELPHFRAALPVGLSLTIPAQYGPPDREILAKSAHNAGFAEERIDFVDEPIAAAQAWLSELGGQDEHVIVLDCGGGTLDWACLHRKDGDTFEMIPELPPGGDNRVGGFDIDEAIFAFVDDEIVDDDTRKELQIRRCLVRDQIRAIKEKYSRTGAGGKLRVGNTRIEIPHEVLDDIIRRRFVFQACQNLNSYLEKVRSKAKLDKPTVLLVGGSARLRGFQQAITEQCKCNAVWWERSEYATVLGALIPTISHCQSSTTEPGKNLAHSPNLPLRQAGCTLPATFDNSASQPSESTHEYPVFEQKPVTYLDRQGVQITSTSVVINEYKSELNAIWSLRMGFDYLKATGGGLLGGAAVLMAPVLKAGSAAAIKGIMSWSYYVLYVNEKRIISDSKDHIKELFDAIVAALRKSGKIRVEVAADYNSASVIRG